MRFRVAAAFFAVAERLLELRRAAAERACFDNEDFDTVLRGSLRSALSEARERFLLVARGC